MSFLSLNKNTLVSLLLASAGAVGAASACTVVDKGEYEFDDAKFDGGMTVVPQGGAGGAGSGTCSAGQFQCTEDGVLLACEDGAFQDEGDGMDCGGAALCNATAGACRECSPGEFRCTDEKLEQCNLDGAAFELTATCADEASCHVSTNRQRGFCEVCVASDALCDPKIVLTAGVLGAGGPQAASELRECNEDGSGTVLTEVCGFDQPICDPTGSGACTRCPPGETRCIDGAVQVCADDGSAWEEDDDCGTVALCDQMAVDGPECITPGCTPGDITACNSAGLIEGCGLDGQPFDIIDCPSQVRCDATKRRCTDCEPGTYRCAGQEVRWCGGLFLDDNVMQTETVRPNFPNPGTEMTYGQCLSGCTASGASYSCAGGLGNRVDMYLSAPGYAYNDWYDYNAMMWQPCPGGELSSGLEVPGICAVCRPDQFWCSGDNELMNCDADGAIISTVDDCGSGVCAYWLERCLPALPGETYCSPQGQLNRVEADGEITMLDQCAGPAACDPERGCLIGSCRVGSTVCAGADVLDCTNGRLVEPSGDECASAARCSPGFGCNAPVALAAGDAHTCAIFAGEDAEDGDAGYLMCWGANESGQLGNGSSILGDSLEARHVVRYEDSDQSKPPLAMPNTTSVCAGKDFTCATVNAPDGSRVACWGSNAKGQLGINSEEITPFNYASALVATEDGPIAGESIACGADFACALGADGSTWCWGANEFGQVGNGAAGDPVILATLIADHAFVSVAAGAHHACGVKDDGAVFCWGQGMGGQLGSGETDDADAPAEVDGVAAIVGITPALGRDFSIVTGEDANPFAFGTNGYGQLATGDTTDAASPVAAEELNSDEIDNLFAGATSAHACARIASTLVCWGANVFGQIGDDSTDTALSPVEVLDGSSNPTRVRPGAHSVAVGGRHTCAINVSNDILCWGANHRNQLATDANTPVTVPTQSL